MRRRLKNSYTFSALEANVWSIPIIIAIAILFFGSFYIIYGKEFLLDGLRSNYLRLYFFIPIFITGCFFHELLHALGFIWFGRVNFSNIKFGVIWKYITPYAYCRIPVSAKVYKISLLMPLIILGIIPYFVSIIWGLLWLNIYSTIFSMLAGGDLLVFFAIKKVDGELLLEDHPE